MQRYEEGTDRNQVQVVSLEDLIGEDNPVRVIDLLTVQILQKWDFSMHKQKKQEGHGRTWGRFLRPGEYSVHMAN